MLPHSMAHPEHERVFMFGPSSYRGIGTAMNLRRRLAISSVIALAAMAVTAAPSSAIVGGSDAGAGEFPSVAEITFGAFGCTGTLISPDTVLTAGHCGSLTGAAVATPVGWPAPLINVRIGSNKPGQGETVPVKSVAVSPKYLLVDGNDVTVLKLSGTSTKAPTKVAGAGDRALWNAGTAATIAGFGTTTEGGDAPDTLQKAQVPVTVRRLLRLGLQQLRRRVDALRRLPRGRGRHLPGRLRRPAVLRRPRDRGHQLRRGLRPPGQARRVRPRGRRPAAGVDPQPGRRRGQLAGQAAVGVALARRPRTASSTLVTAMSTRLPRNPAKPIGVGVITTSTTATQPSHLGRMPCRRIA